MQNLRIEKLKNLSLAALLMAGAAFAACSSSSDEIIEPVTPESPTTAKTYTLTIKASKGSDAATRALTPGYDSELNKNTVDATWAEGEQVTVYNETEGAALEGSLVAQSTGASTTLSGTLTGTINPNDILTLKFCSPNYGSQDGTLGYIAANCDYATASVTVSSVASGNITTTGDADFTNKQAIVKFTFKDKASDATISPSAIVLSVDVDPTLETGPRGVAISKAADAGMTLPYVSRITIPDATYSANGAGIVYLAIPDKLEEVPELKELKGMFEFTLTAIVGDKVYSLTKSGFPFENGQYYEITAKMTEQVWDGDLAKLTAEMPETFATATDGMTITGTLGVNKKISIADGATVTLDGVIINGTNDYEYKYAGITCLGDAIIILKDGTTNTVKGFCAGYPGIFVPGDKDNPNNNNTLTIQGTGTLDASSNSDAPGIGGGGYEISCGNIVIESGTITANGGFGAAGIGGVYQGSCGTITISGGTVTANGGSGGAGIGSSAGGSCSDINISGGNVTANSDNYGAGIGSGDGGDCGIIKISGGSVTATSGYIAAGIGTGYAGGCGDITISSGTVEATGGEDGAGIGTGDSGRCGAITITSDVTSVTATAGKDAKSIGAGWNGTCGTVTIGGTVYWGPTAADPSEYEYKNGGNTYLANSPLVYPEP